MRPYSLTVKKAAGERYQLRIMVASDIHLGNIIGNRFLKNLIKKTEEIKPDLILIPGDLLDGDIEPFKRNQMAETLRSLNAPVCMRFWGIMSIMVEPLRNLSNLLKMRALRCFRMRRLK